MPLAERQRLQHAAPPALPMTPTSGTTGNDKIVGIELLRFASAVSVLVFHYYLFLGIETTGNNLDSLDVERLPFYSFLKPLYAEGGRGVQVFWCISGFIFFWKYGEPISRRKTAGFEFFVLRFSRLYPLHFLTLMLVALLQSVYFLKAGSYFVYQNNDWYHFILQLLFASDWGFQKAFSFNGPIWSISVEVLVYALFYFTVRHGGVSPLTMVLISAAAGAVFVSHLTFNPLFSCIMLFYIGGFTALVFKKVGANERLSSLVSTLALVVIAAVVTAISLHTGMTRKISPYWYVLVCSPALIFLFAKHLQLSGRWAVFLSVLGNMTYSSYLLHFPLFLLVATLAKHADATIPLNEPLFFTCFIGITLTLSYFCYRYVEMPSQDWIRRRLLLRQRSAAAYRY